MYRMQHMHNANRAVVTGNEMMVSVFGGDDDDYTVKLATIHKKLNCDDVMNDTYDDGSVRTMVVLMLKDVTLDASAADSYDDAWPLAREVIETQSCRLL
jgi:predicted ATPase